MTAEERGPARMTGASTTREDVEALAKRLKRDIDWRPGSLCEQAAATLRALLDRCEAAELGRATAAARIEELSAALERMREALQWMVDNDETNEGDTPLEELNGKTWNEVNAYWIEGLNRARAALAGAPRHE